MLGPPAEGHWGLCDFQQSRPTEGLSTAAAGFHSIRTSLQWGDSAPCPTAGCFGRVVLPRGYPPSVDGLFPVCQTCCRSLLFPHPDVFLCRFW